MKEIFRVKSNDEGVMKVDVITLNPKIILLVVTNKAVYTKNIKVVKEKI